MTANFTSSAQTRGNPEERSTQFVPVEGAAPATDAGTFMVAAYVLMWLCTVFFILLTWRKARGIQNRVNELQKAISKLPQVHE
jgi:hypothetical protein